MGLKEIRDLKERAKEPKAPKKYIIPKVSAKRKAKLQEDKKTLERDKEFYKEVYAASPHTCQNCNCRLPKEPQTFFFHHVLEKRNYPQFRYTPENIMILCLVCHNQWHLYPDKAPKIRIRMEEARKILNI